MIERLTITLPAPMADAVREAVDEGGYASTSEVVREALRDWRLKRAHQAPELNSLKADVNQGLADLAEGRTKPFKVEDIVEKGRLAFAARSSST